MADKTEKPAIRVSENPFGDFSPEQMAGKPQVDRFYLKGYSDLRHERDLETQKAIKAGRSPALKPLNHRFQYVPVERPDGSPNKSKYVEWVAKGYRTVKYDELESLGIDLAGSTAERGPDGSARVGSQLLMVADADVAARNFREQRELTEKQFEDHVIAPLQAAEDRYNQKFGHTGKKTGTKMFVQDEKVKE